MNNIPLSELIEFLDAHKMRSEKIRLFYTAEKYRQTAEALRSMQWVSVGERLPNKRDRSYLTLDKYGDIENTLFDGHRFVYVINGTEYPDNDITHWMPLPEPPKEEGNE